VDGEFVLSLSSAKGAPRPQEEDTADTGEDAPQGVDVLRGECPAVDRPQELREPTEEDALDGGHPRHEAQEPREGPADFIPLEEDESTDEEEQRTHDPHEAVLIQHVLHHGHRFTGVQHHRDSDEEFRETQKSGES